MRHRSRFLGLVAVLILGTTLLLLTSLASAKSGGGADKVRWDIIHLIGGGFPGPATAGGHASASTPAPNSETITLTGTGTFVAPPGGNGGSHAVTGGGTWSIAGGASGTYQVTELVSWAFANFQATTPLLTDNIGGGQRANGTAVLKIDFSDGTDGVLTVGCHGPGAPDGIFEGIATTKGYKTYYIVQPPANFVDANRTIFHVR